MAEKPEPLKKTKLLKLTWPKTKHFKVASSTSIMLGSHPFYLAPQHFHHPRKPMPINQFLLMLLLTAPGNHQSAFHTYRFAILDISDKWYIIVKKKRWLVHPGKTLHLMNQNTYIILEIGWPKSLTDYIWGGVGYTVFLELSLVHWYYSRVSLLKWWFKYVFKHWLTWNKKEECTKSYPCTLFPVLGFTLMRLSRFLEL